MTLRHGESVCYGCTYAEDSYAYARHCPEGRKYLGAFFMLDDKAYMERALALAEKGRGPAITPGAMVGCVIVRDGAIIGEGFHAKAGEPHAEVNALRDAGDVSDATLYITLEPCCHHGRTPPCVDLLREKRPARIVVAMEDPNPIVAGKGIQILREAGIKVEVGLLEDRAQKLNEVFTKFITTRTPFVIAKCGMSLDGKIATRSGDSKWVTDEAAREMVHQLRNQVDAILVGSRTVMLDDPSLTTRLPDEQGSDKIRVIIDSAEYLDRNRKVFQLDSDAPTWVVVSDDRDVDQADDVIRVSACEQGLDLSELMLRLGERDVTSVLIEGGGTTLASAFEKGIVDKVMFFIAPKIVGGSDAITAVDGIGAEHMADAIQLTDMNATPIGPDLLIEAYVRKD